VLVTGTNVLGVIMDTCLMEPIVMFVLTPACLVSPESVSLNAHQIASLVLIVRVFVRLAMLDFIYLADYVMLVQLGVLLALVELFVILA